MTGIGKSDAKELRRSLPAKNNPHGTHTVLPFRGEKGDTFLQKKSTGLSGRLPLTLHTFFVQFIQKFVQAYLVLVVNFFELHAQLVTGLVG